MAEPFADLTHDLRTNMPELRGALVANAPLAALTWFRVGGPAQLLFTPADEADLAYAIGRLPADLPVMVVGLGSNLIVRDGGVPGMVVRLMKGFTTIKVDGLSVRAGAGAPDVKVARAAAEAGIDGLAFLRGIPGSIGGALPTNAGAHGGAIADVFVEARGIDRRGRIRVFDREAMGFTYRHCAAADDNILFTEALFQGRPGEPAKILAEMERITAAREASQPIKDRTGGSTFANPPGHSAWRLVDEAGCRGLTRGDAQVSPMHTNFLLNRGKATAADIEGLGEEVRARVLATSGIELRWEIRRIGVP